MKLIEVHARSVLALVAGLACASLGHAAAFKLKEQSAAGQGRAFAGSISEGGDASVIANNPAAMTLLDGRLIQADAAVVTYSAKFDGSGRDALGRPLSGGNGGDAGQTAVIPSLYFHAPVTDRIHLGFSVTAPFGFKTEYDDGWVGRYQGVKTSLKVIDAGVSGAYKVNEVLSLGVSVFAERLDVKLRNAVDFGAQLAAARVPGFLPTSADGFLDVEGDNTEVGYTLGALLRPADGTTVGLAYRSEVKHKAKGVDARFSVPAAANAVLSVAAPNTFVNTTVDTELTMPASWTLSVSQRLSPQWTVMADYSRTSWSKFDKVVLDFASNLPNQTLDFGYRDSSFYSVGTEYRMNDAWTFRGGFAYDQTPVTDAVRDVRVPDVSRRWLSLGATWRTSKQLAYSVGYTHLFIKDTSVNLTSPSASTLQGSYKVGSDILAVSAQYSF
ncbi:outer membrane protein transport protein [Roseateles chitinivorans]|uniref:outer membrane protein transport protein n=1 Tax=Roseateles chitinivorans TaxID=2917965 RepID=UPI003D67055C